MNTDETLAYYKDSPAAQWIAFGVICIGSFFATMTVSAVNIAIPTIALELNASAVQIAWLPGAFILTNIIAILPAGRLSDTIGRKKIYASGLSLFCLSSLLSGLVGNIEQLLLMRALQGISAAMIFATGMALVVSIIPAEKRGVALGIAAACLYLGLTCGPAIGGFLSEYYGWRSVFFFQVPLTFIAVLLIFFKVKGDWKNDLQEPLDWQGALLFAAFIPLFFLAVSLFPNPIAYLLLLMGVVLAFIFVRLQLNKAHPLIRFKVLAENKRFSKSLLSSVLVYGSAYPLIFIVSLYLQYVRGFTPSEAGQLLMVPAVFIAMVAPVAGKFSDMFNPKRIATIGCLLASTGFLILFGLTDHDTLLYTIIGLIFFGIGFGFFSTPNNNAAMSSVDKERLGIASALMSLSRVSGNMLGSLTIMLLFSITIGGQEIQPENYAELTRVVYWILALAVSYTLFAAWLAFSDTESS